MTYKEFALDLAHRSGKIMLEHFALGMDKEIKADGSPVTKADLAINSLVVDEVNKNFPDHGVMGEEQSHKIENAQFVWVCDPVDGTIPFSHGMPTCVFSLALVQNGEAVLGVAYDPFLDRMAFAEKGQGAYINGKKIHVSDHRQLNEAYISHVLWSKMLYPMPGFIDDVVFEKKGQNFPVGSIVYTGILLAAGQLEGITFGHDTAHDVAALKIIVEEAGGKVTDLWGNDQRYDAPIKGCLISNGLIHDELVQFAQAHLKV